MKYTIGVGLNFFDAKAVLLREDGKVMLGVEQKRTELSPNHSIELLIELVASVVNKSKKYKNDIIGACFSLSCIVDKKTGIVYYSQEN